ncbi:MAG: hypothetical protein KatS3mg108_0471 [Isosphaeraceae bacterium]|jgi:hypothetical protein|nr:MAG: hypothetical protein KatS3mg108_0471 [Isosphaeraceae bacterium]
MSDRRRQKLDTLEDRLSGPKRVGLFGHRAVGKTTLLAILYREASAGRLPGVRLAAGDAVTAEYLADKIAEIESGQPPAGTLAETPLRLRLYHGSARLDLIVKDYQGEHVGLGSEAAILDFFAECDAVFLCLDGERSADSGGRRRRQQEIEALLERYLDGSGDGSAGRPVAVLVTRYDRVLEAGGPPAEQVERLVQDRYGMTRHALAQHVPDAAVFAVSAYGPGVPPNGSPPPELHPLGLDAPLAWLAERLEAIDRSRLEWLFDIAPDDLPRLERCLGVYERRYPQAAGTIALRRQLAAGRRKARRRRWITAAAGVAVLAAGVAGYDAWGYRQALALERSAAGPAEIERGWDRLFAWHPTLPYLFPAEAQTARLKRAEWKVRAAEHRVATGAAPPLESQRLRDLKAASPELAAQVARLEQTELQARMERDWQTLRVADLVAIENPAAHLDRVRQYLRHYPDTPYKDQAVALARDLEARIATQRARDERQAIDALTRAAALPDASWPDLIAQAEAFLRDHPETQYRNEVDELIRGWLLRQDEADIERAREFSRDHPTHFAARRQKYEEYLRDHRHGGRFVAEANAALEQIDAQSDAYLYRLAYDHHAAYPNDVPAVAERLRAYLNANPNGRYAAAAREYLAWWERIASPADYQVVLRRGRVEPTVGKPLAGAGPDLSVSLTVAGVDYGPSPIIKDTHTPIWDYRFARPIRWKYGDPVAIRIVDNDWSATTVYTLTSAPDDPLGIRLLSGSIKPRRGGRTELVFASDFREPVLPKPE